MIVGWKVSIGKKTGLPPVNGYGSFKIKQRFPFVKNMTQIMSGLTKTGIRD